MNRKESVYFVIGIALTAVLFTFLLNGASPWMSMAQIFLMRLNFHTNHYQPITDFSFARDSRPKGFKFQFIQIPK